MIIPIESDAWSSGQIGSKIWACEELEKIYSRDRISFENIAVLGGWQGVLSFLLLSRNNIKINKIKSYDIDPKCEVVADTINEYWVWQNWKFKSFTMDGNNIDFSEFDLIINTSSEHFESKQWWDNIPKGKYVLIQSNNMDHDDHIFCFQNLDEFSNEFKLSDILYLGEKKFQYSDWGFNRWMIIGKK